MNKPTEVTTLDVLLNYSAMTGEIYHIVQIQSRYISQLMMRMGQSQSNPSLLRVAEKMRVFVLALKELDDVINLEGGIKK